jgi:hypothetical protein
MREVSDLYPDELFPKGTISAEIEGAANLAVRLSYARSGRYGAALLIREIPGPENGRLVVEEKDMLPYRIAVNAKCYAKTDGSMPEIRVLGNIGIHEAHHGILEQLYGLLPSEVPDTTDN